MPILAKIIPVVMACILGAVIFFMLGSDASHMTKSSLQKLQAKNPKQQVMRADSGQTLQFEAYGKPVENKYRVQVQLPGTATFYDPEGKVILKKYFEMGDEIVTIPPKRAVDVIAFEPFDWEE